ncbi:nicotinate (nicotinamide) nucleotide adenylyltransferase [Candidatus Thioglobus sp.]|uniref:nicotinate (nicotinamide) nucleotide adenylyltransferase n=1 Tax=Candidatus Thioglobus sp. TaxID=2026721 RepID=UPI003D09F86B
MIGFFGGSFDPVHLGHLNSAQQLKKQLNLTQLFLMPCHTPVHKKCLTFSTQQRLEMLEIAIENFPELSIDTGEITQPVASYTIDSLKRIAKQYPQQSFGLIIGMDSFNQLSSWKNYQTFWQYCHLIVVGRPGQEKIADTYNFTQVKNKAALNNQASGLVYFSQTKLYDISSSDIRGILFNDASSGKIPAQSNLAELLPIGVINYLKKL